MDWLDITTSDPAKEKEEDMSSLTIGFVARIRKRAMSTEEETTLTLKYLAESPRSSLAQMKRLKRTQQ